MCEILSEFLLSHSRQLFRVSNCVFDLFNFLEYFVFVGRKSVFFSVEGITNASDLGEDVGA